MADNTNKPGALEITKAWREKDQTGRTCDSIRNDEQQLAERIESTVKHWKDGLSPASEFVLKMADFL